MAKEAAADEHARIQEAAAYIREKIGGRGYPAITCAVALGSGLGGFAETLADRTAIPYADIPYFPRSTAPGHKGVMVFGRLPAATAETAAPAGAVGAAGTAGAVGAAGAASPAGAAPFVVCMQGRFHIYEGYSMREAALYVRVLSELGVRRVILTNACGGLEPAWNVGDLMLIADHINLMGANPLAGPNMGMYGPRFPDMSRAYSPAMRAIAMRAAAELGITLREGVYAGMLGPSYETPAEIRALRALGVSAVGMSTVPEAIAANHCGMEVCGISCVTNMAAGILDQPLTEREVIETAERTGPLFERLVARIIGKLPGTAAACGL